MKVSNKDISKVGDIISAIIVPNKVFYPKGSNVIESGEWGIFSAKITDLLYKSNPMFGLKNIKLKGTVPRIEYKTEYKVTCELVEKHESYGDTYEIKSINKNVDLSSPDKLRNYLETIYPKSVTMKIFDKCESSELHEMLEKKDLEGLKEVVSEWRAKRMIEGYHDSLDYSDMYVELKSYGFSKSMFDRLKKFYNSPNIVIDVVKNKPYDLVRMKGISFKRADEIALKSNIDRNSPQRISAFIRWYLGECGENGQSWIQYKQLMSEMYKTLGNVNQETISQSAKALVDNNVVVAFPDGRIALRRYYNLESRIKEELLRILNAECDTVVSEEVAKTKIKEIELRQGFSFSDEQLDAILTGVKSNIVCITGIAGAGKSSSLNGLVNIYDESVSIQSCALSGKAAVRITECTGKEATTIHKALGIGYETYTKEEDTVLSCDILVLDEASMVNGTLFLELLKAIPNGTKLVILGDIHQLTAIGNCQIFRDMLESEIIPTVRLTKPQRQSLESGIIEVATKVAYQEQFFTEGYIGDLAFGKNMDMIVRLDNNSNQIESTILYYYAQEFKLCKDVTKLQVIVPVKTRGLVSCYNLNVKLQEIANPKLVNDRFIKKQIDSDKSYEIRVRDRVINTVNNYNTTNTSDKKTPIFNGNIGTVVRIEDDSVIVDFDYIGEIIVPMDNVSELELAYACSGHKMQGSSADIVIVGLDTNSFMLNNCEWLYTALTRAKEKCILVGNTESVKKAIATREMNNKQTFLKEFLLETKHN